MWIPRSVQESFRWPITREWFCLRQFTLFVFRGRCPHIGTIAPPTSAIEGKLRINLILYPQSKSESNILLVRKSRYVRVVIIDFSCCWLNGFLDLCPAGWYRIFS